MLSRALVTPLKNIIDLVGSRCYPLSIVYIVLGITIVVVAYVILEETIFTGLSRWYLQVATFFGCTEPGVIIIAWTFHRKKLAKEALRQGRLYRIMAEYTHDWVYWLDPNLQLIYTSPSCERVTGYGRVEFLNDSSLLSSFIHPADRVIVEKHTYEKLDAKESTPIEYRIIHRNGEERWIRHTCRPVYGMGGKFLGWRACNSDITCQKQAEKESALALSLLKATVESTVDGILVVDQEGEIRLYNQRFLDMWQIPPSAIASGDDNQVLAAVLEQLEDPQGFLRGVKELYARPGDESHDQIVFKDGKVFERYSRPQRLGTLIVGRVWSFLDITERIQAQEELSKTNEEYEALNEELIASNEELMAAEEELRSQYEELQRSKQELNIVNQRLLNIIEFLPDATFVIDHEQRIVAWNRAIEEMTGVPKDNIIGKGDYAYAIPFYGKPKPVVIDLIGDPNIKIHHEYQHLYQKGDTLFAEVSVPTLYLGRGAFLWIKASPMYDAEGNIIGAIQSIRDITGHKRAEEQLKYLSLHDSLTGLYNRTYFEQEMRRFKNIQYAPFGIILCDVDGLKLINDTMGHDSGDKLLMTVANVLRKTFRSDDVVARIGGDEFAVLLPKSAINVVERAAARLRDAVSQHNLENPKILLSISLGFAVSDEIPADLDKVFKEADNNMYRTKLHHSQSARSAIVQTLMKALEARDFVTEGHVDRLQNLVAAVGSTLGLPERSIGDLRLLAQFHDIGKVGIPDRILFKKGPLTAKEFAEMKQHSEIGHRIALSAPDLVPIADWVLKHHEWWNGKGYPLGLKGEEIPLECRILAIADAYDAMTNDRPYRKAMSSSRAIAELKKCAGTQFDPHLVMMFVQHLENQKQEWE